MNLPNKITITRILMIPFMVFAFYLDDMINGFAYAGIISAVIFIIAAFSDLIDGYIARRDNIVTTIGKFLDPIADKILVVSALMLLLEDGLILPPVGAVFSVLIIARELIIGGFRQIAASRNIVIAADLSGKIKTVMQDIAMVMFLLSKSLAYIALPAVITTVYMVISYVVFAAAVILTVWSGLSYILKNKAVFNIK